MKIYDTHSDVFYNLYSRSQQHCIDPFKKYHLDALTKGEVKGGIWVVYSEHDFDVYEAYKIALDAFRPYEQNYHVIKGLEGLRNVHNLDELNRLYELGIRHASLTWNEENHLATGVAGEKERGLTNLGKQFLDYMYEHHMIIDVSHLNIKSFYDVIEYMPHNIIASHSNAFALSDHRRNLNDDQLRVLREVNGYVGAVSARNFVSKNPSYQNTIGLANQIIYLGEKLGIDHVMLGLDIMDYLSDYEGENANLDNLKGHMDAQNIITELLNRGLSLNEVEQIAYRNFENYKKGIKLDE